MFPIGNTGGDYVLYKSSGLWNIEALERSQTMTDPINKDGSLDAVIVGKWTVGYSHNPVGMALLLFEFDNRPPINLAIPPDQAEAIAKAILENLRNPPPRRNRQN